MNSANPSFASSDAVVKCRIRDEHKPLCTLAVLAWWEWRSTTQHCQQLQQQQQQHHLKLGFMESGAHRALGWYKELDCEFRSTRTGAQYEAITSCAPRLLQLSLEPPLCEAAANVCKLDRGQNEAYANALVLRLADIFQAGSNAVRLCILKALLHVYNGHKKQGRASTEPLLSSKRIASPGEILKHVKSVASSGDVTARCLAFRALGCLVGLETEVGELCCLILASLDSEHKQEVEAALFAAGCLSEISAQSASIFLRRVQELAGHLKTPPEIKVAAVRMLSKMSLIPFEAHEEGRKLMLRLPDSALVEATLTALSKLATSSKLVLPNQAQLLLEYVRHDPRAQVQVVSLVSLEQILPRVSYIESGHDAFTPLYSMLEEAPIALRLQSLRVLAKALKFFNASDLEAAFCKVELSALDENPSVALEALRVLVELACKLEKAQETVPETGSNQMDVSYNDSSVDYLTRLVLLLCDRLALVDPLDDRQLDYGHIFSRLGDGCPRAAALLVDCLMEMVEAIISKGHSLQNTVEGTDIVMRDAVEFSAKDISKVALLCRCLRASCRNRKQETGRLLSRVALVTELLSTSDGFGSVYISLALLLVVMGDRRMLVGEAQLQHATEELDSWRAYKFARYCCRIGFWSAAEKAFVSISNKVSTENCYFWLTALSEMSSAESMLCNRGSDKETGVQSLRLLQAALRSLEAAGLPLEFQTKLLKLRIQLLRLELDILVLCDSIQRNHRLNASDLKVRQVYGRARNLVDQLRCLAKEFFILGISFLGIDLQSLQDLHGATLQCSLLALCIACAVSGSHADNTDTFKVAEGFMRREGELSEATLVRILEQLVVGDLRCKRSIPRQTAEVMRSVHRKLSRMKLEQMPQRMSILREVCDDLRWMLPRQFFRPWPQARLDWWIAQEGITKHEASEHISVCQGDALSLSLGFKVVNLREIKLRRLSCLLSTTSSTRGERSEELWSRQSSSKDVRLLRWLCMSKGRDMGVVTVAIRGQRSNAFSSCTLNTAGLAPGSHDLTCAAVGLDDTGALCLLPCAAVFRFKVST